MRKSGTRQDVDPQQYYIEEILPKKLPLDLEYVRHPSLCERFAISCARHQRNGLQSDQLEACAAESIPDLLVRH